MTVLSKNKFANKNKDDRRVGLLLLPQLPKEIMERISRGGYECYLVGGCVRDLLMSRQPVDYDFVTDRKPEQIISAALEAGWKVRKYGEAFGIIHIVIGKEKFEVASMRTENYGKDPHRPETVTFVGDLYQDLARRDFTMNAVAMDKDGRLIDPFGGVNDIRNGVIRCIGSPKNRFLEDPLRILRASRFVVQTGFDLEETIPTAMSDRDIQQRFRELSVERVRDEFEKILLAPRPSPGLKLLIDTGVLGLSCSAKEGGKKIRVDFLPEIMQLNGVPQNPRYHRYDVLTHILRTVDEAPPVHILRWAALLHDVAKGRPGVRTLNKRGELSDRGHHLVGAGMAQRILGRLKVPRRYVQRIVWLIKNHRNLPPADRQGLIRWAFKRSRDFSNRHEFMEAAQQLFLLGRADDASKGRETSSFYFHFLLSQFPKIASGLTFYPYELKISGDDIVKKTGAGPIVGKILNSLLTDVQKGKIMNTPEALRAAVQKYSYFRQA